MKNTTLHEDNLVEYLIKGDEAAYTLLVDLYYDKLCNYASSLARDSVESEDFVQNVIVRLWQRRHKLDAQISIKNYLYKSVYNEFVTYYRKHSAVTALEKKYIEGLDTVYVNQEKRDTKGLKTIIEQEIEKLPKKCKQTFLLSKKEGLTYTEIAEYQNISVSTVESHMARAFSILRSKLKDKVQHFLFMVFGLRRRVLKKGY
ncbi:RNA polymerase sigma-70 factor [Flavivirga amylovorans]|uniref:RNA polymerase sigma-70 factor n=1 Tax=Flavivirga amylovorans TaxID=870486 RepID=A0ABT8X0N7_9FLAO|nr:RNA polymerase sigma-70 factor [Flavivirga amylovorans]MDO5987513.1 RNA polymerase sigma-70 factor [Flavivirga amylovorans]